MSEAPPAFMRRYLLFWGGIILVLSSVNLFRAWRQPEDIWWTPKSLSVPLTESQDRVRVYLRGEPLENIVNGTRLLVAGETGAVPVGPTEVSMRFNNRERVRAERMPTILSAGIGIGAGGILLLLGIVGLRPRRAQATA